MPIEILPIQNINNIPAGILIGSGNTCNTSFPAFAVGVDCYAGGPYSYAEGSATSAIGAFSHAEGAVTSSDGSYSHAEGYKTSAYSTPSHAEGYETIASGPISHAEGQYTRANGAVSHAQGYNTVANANFMTVIGKYNFTTSAAFVIGNGTGTGTSADDAFVVDWDGTVSATKFLNSAGEIPAIVPTGSQPAGTTACSLYISSDGTIYAVTGT